tara:strand:- start:268 stop:453 length:186 start_codon:yes stop_codon:yes gene_type:complete
MKVYTLTIVYNEDKEEIEYICEEVTDDSDNMIMEYGTMVLNDYFDEEGLELISGCYIIGEA